MSVNSKMTAMANSIRALLGLTGTMGLEAMVTHIGTEKTNVDNALAAIVDKGVEVPAGANSGNLAELIASITGGGGGSFPNGTEWTQSNITDAKFMDMAYGNGVWILGTDENLYRSTDGKTWTVVPDMEGDYSVVLYADGLWIVVLDDTPLISIDEGLTWELVPSDALGSYAPNDIHKANGLYVCTFMSQGCMYSYDGANWEYCDGLERCMSVRNANGVWVAGGYNNGLHYSIDGITWTQSNITSGRFYAVKYANGLWVAVEGNKGYGIYYSADGKTWTQSNIANVKGRGVDQARGVWVAVTTSGFYYSYDGKTWTQSNVNSTLSYPRAVHYANGIWVACGGPLFYSTDGTIWHECSNVGSYHVEVIAEDGIWVAANYLNGVYYSVTWELS